MKKKERKKGCKLTHKTNEEKSKKVEIKIKKKKKKSISSTASDYRGSKDYCSSASEPMLTTS